MFLPTPRSTRTYTLLPYTTLFRSVRHAAYNRGERRVRGSRLGNAGESEAVPERSVEVLRGHRIATATAGMVHPGAEHTAVGLHHELGGRNRAPPLALDRRIDLRLDLAGERRHRRPPQRVVDEEIGRAHV